MYSKNLKPTLTILDVGHGNAAVLQGHEGVIVIDAGNDPTLYNFLKNIHVFEIQALLLSHSDYDHIKGAITLLMSNDVNACHVFLNPDPSQNSIAFKQLRYALFEAEKLKKTQINPSLTSSTLLQLDKVKIEVLYPSAADALGGIGGENLSSKRLTTNSLCAAIRVVHSDNASVLLGGDVEFECLNDWENRGIDPQSQVLVFPHHGGLPSGYKESEAFKFAFSITKVVIPEFVIFSIHKSRYDLPRDGILEAIRECSNNINFLCTQLPDRFHDEIYKNPVWMKHRTETGKGYNEGSIVIELSDKGIELSFLNQDL
jgi:competence protein ComEC